LETLSFVKIRVIWDWMPGVEEGGRGGRGVQAPPKHRHPSLELHGVKILLLTAVCISKSHSSVYDWQRQSHGSNTLATNLDI